MGEKNTVLDIRVNGVQSNLSITHSLLRLDITDMSCLICFFHLFQVNNTFKIGLFSKDGLVDSGTDSGTLL